MSFAGRECEICKSSFTPRRRADKTCSLDCQVRWRRQLSRRRQAQHYEPRPPRPDITCESCGTSVPVPKTGPTPKRCTSCRASREVLRGQARTSVRRCYKCGKPVPGATRQPGKAVCDDCRVDPRKRGKAHEQRRRLRGYGLTQESYDELLASQGGRCRGCQAVEPGVKGWCVDHCHRTGRIRALLCHRCNTTLGLVNEDPATLRALADFIEQDKDMV